MWNGLHVLVLPKRMEAIYGPAASGLGLGLITIAGGLAMLSEDVEWAGKATDWLKSRTGRSRPDDNGDGAGSDQAGG